MDGCMLQIVSKVRRKLQKKKKKSHVEGFYTSSGFTGLVYDHLFHQTCDFLSQVTLQLCSHSWLKEQGAAPRPGWGGFCRVWSLWSRSADAVGDGFSGG